MSSCVVATAGHVDHGKSTLIRALTGIEPDRWAEERRRGLTIDLGFAWMRLPSGRDVAFVDVPGHKRFLGNMLAGLGPAPVVLFVVAADEGWRAQSSDHRDAVAALGIDGGLLVVSRADRAPERVADVVEQARTELAGTGLRNAPAVVVSGVTGVGLDALRDSLDEVLARQPLPNAHSRVRLWVDRSFSITGAGTVVTGTLSAGTLRRGDALDVAGSADRPQPTRRVTIRGLESENQAQPAVGPVSRVALNLRGAASSDLLRGEALVTPDVWRLTELLDVRGVSGPGFDQLPEQLTVHIGTAAIPARLRPFDSSHARLRLDRALPLTVGDRLILRNPGNGVIGGAQVLDAEPPELRRRGDAARRASVLTTMRPDGDLAVEVARRGVVAEAQLRRLGLLEGPVQAVPEGVRVVDGWWLDTARCAAWARQLRTAVEELHRRDPLAAGLSRGAAQDLLGLSAAELVDVAADEAGLVLNDGYLSEPGHVGELGPAEAAVAELERRLATDPFQAPEADDLVQLGLGVRELAAAERADRLLRLRDGIVVLPRSPALAMRTLAQLDQPFTTSEARQALGTTRRVVIPLLEHLDSRGWTRRLDAGHREVVVGRGSGRGS